MHDRRPLLQALRGLPDRRRLRSEAGDSGNSRSAAAADCRRRRDWDSREHPNRAAGGCYGRVRFVQNEASDGERPDTETRGESLFNSNKNTFNSSQWVNTVILLVFS